MLVDRILPAHLDRAVSLAAHRRFHGSVVRPVRQGLPALARADRVRTRGVVRRGPGRQRGEAFLPAGGAHRFPARGHRRRAGLRRRRADRRDRFTWIVVRAFAIGRRAAVLERYFSSLVAQGIGLWIGVQAIINMGVNMGDPAHEGPHAAAAVVRRQRARGDVRRARHSAARRLGEQAAREGPDGMTAPRVASAR